MDAIAEAGGSRVAAQIVRLLVAQALCLLRFAPCSAERIVLDEECALLFLVA